MLEMSHAVVGLEFQERQVFDRCDWPQEAGAHEAYLAYAALPLRYANQLENNGSPVISAPTEKINSGTSLRRPAALLSNAMLSTIDAT
jgi:hypothetical protein